MADVLVLPSLLLSASNVVDGTLIISIARFNVHITIESFRKELRQKVDRFWILRLSLNRKEQKYLPENNLKKSIIFNQ